MLRLTTLLGLGCIYSAEGLSGGVFAARTGRHLGWNCSRAWGGSRQILDEHHHMETASCLRISNRRPHVSRSPPPCMTAGGSGEGDPETTTAAPRLKRVRRRRKDASLIPPPGENGGSDSASRVYFGQQQPEQPKVIAAGATRAAVVEASAAVIETSTATPEEEILRTPATPAIQESPVYVGGTKGTKVMFKFPVVSGYESSIDRHIMANVFRIGRWLNIRLKFICFLPFRCKRVDRILRVLN